MSNYYRKHAKFIHKILGFYASINAWERKLDCVVLTRQDLLFYFNTKRIKQVRIDWFIEDVKKWFTFHHILTRCKNEQIASIYLTNKVIKPWPIDRMTDNARMKRLQLRGINTKRVFNQRDERIGLLDLLKENQYSLFSDSPKPKIQKKKKLLKIRHIK